MTRLRYSLAEAETEAKRLAIEHVRKMDLWPGAVFGRVTPSNLSPKNPSSKHPVGWLVAFDTPCPEGDIVDGGELIFDVNIDTKEVHQLDIG